MSKLHDALLVLLMVGLLAAAVCVAAVLVGFGQAVVLSIPDKSL